MLVKIERIEEDNLSTLGQLYIDGLSLCYTLEDAWHKTKIAGSTRIPAGTYSLGLRKVGGFNSRYQVDPRFRDIHKGMIQVLDVPDYTYILFHCGNTNKDTAGCFLMGSSYTVRNLNMPNEEYIVYRSAVAYKKIYPIIADELERGNEVTLEVIDVI